MDENKILTQIVFTSTLAICANISYAGDFNRFSVSAGWLHVMPQSNANPFRINTAVQSESSYTVGSISTTSLLNSISSDALIDGAPAKSYLQNLLSSMSSDQLIAANILDTSGKVTPTTSGLTSINGIDKWTERGTGLEAKNFDTLGLMLNYYINDNVSLLLIGGFPPKVDIKGKGAVVANMEGLAFPGGAMSPLFPNGLPLKEGIPITNLGEKNKAASVRAWTPTIEVQYQFGKSGVSKFRPFVGVGVMYAHFTNIKLNGEIAADLVAAGHKVQNILDNKAGMALDGLPSSGNMRVKVKTIDSFSPVVTLGATYDITSKWYGVASISYSKMNNDAIISVLNSTTGNQLLKGITKVDIDPIITYLGLGYRF